MCANADEIAGIPEIALRPAGPRAVRGMTTPVSGSSMRCCLAIRIACQVGQSPSLLIRSKVSKTFGISCSAS